jgi:hypothetical protein
MHMQKIQVQEELKAMQKAAEYEQSRFVARLRPYLGACQCAKWAVPRSYSDSAPSPPFHPMASHCTALHPTPLAPTVKLLEKPILGKYPQLGEGEAGYRNIDRALGQHLLTSNEVKENSKRTMRLLMGDLFEE